MSTFRIRPEIPADIPAIKEVTTAAFADLAHSQQTEAAIVDKLRDAESLSLSLVAATGSEILGHIAATEVVIAGSSTGWFGIGPVSVRPDWQQAGVGTALMGNALDQLRAEDAEGAVVLGEPAYYARFGFEVVPGLMYPQAPAEFFMAVRLNSRSFPQGVVEYHPAFAG